METKVEQTVQFNFSTHLAIIIEISVCTKAWWVWVMYNLENIVLFVGRFVFNYATENISLKTCFVTDLGLLSPTRSPPTVNCDSFFGLVIYFIFLCLLFSFVRQTSPPLPALKKTFLKKQFYLLYPHDSPNIAIFLSILSVDVLFLLEKLFKLKKDKGNWRFSEPKICSYCNLLLLGDIVAFS